MPSRPTGTAAGRGAAQVAMMGWFERVRKLLAGGDRARPDPARDPGPPDAPGRSPDPAPSLSNLELPLPKAGDEVEAEARRPITRVVEVRRIVVGPDRARTSEAERLLPMSQSHHHEHRPSTVETSQRASASGPLFAPAQPWPDDDTPGHAVSAAPVAWGSPSGGSPGRRRNHDPAASLRDDLVELAAAFDDLAERVSDTASQLLEAGTPPTDDLVDEMAFCRREFQALHDRVRGELSSRGAPGDDGILLESLHDLSGRLQWLGSAPVDRPPVPATSGSVPMVWGNGNAHHVPSHPGAPGRARALAVVEEVLRLTLVGSGDPGVLAACQATAARLREALTGGAPPPDSEELAQLAEGRHPLVELLTFVERHDTLGDTEWADCHEAIGRTFGRPLAMAVSRGRVRPGAD